MELAEIAIWISAASLAVSVLNTVFNIRKGFAETAEKARIADARWRLDVGIDAPNNADPYRSVCVTHQNTTGIPLTIRGVSLCRGRRFRLLGAEKLSSTDEPPGTLIPNPLRDTGRHLTEEDVHLRQTSGPQNGSTHSEAWFFVEVPVKPWGVMTDLTKFRISLTVEEVSAKRRQSQIVLTSVKIPWASRSAERMT